MQSGGTPLELRQYLEILRRHKWLIIELALVGGLVAGIASNARTPLFRSTAMVLLTPNDPNQRLNPTTGNGVSGNDADRYVAGQMNIVQSEGVAAEAVKSLSSATVDDVERKVNVSQAGRSNVLKVSATDPSPDLARDIAQAVAKGYIENRRLAAVSGLQGAADDIQEKLGPLQAQIAQLDTQIGEGPTLPGASATIASPARPAVSTPPVQATTQIGSPTGTLGGAPTTQEALKAARYAAAVQYETLYSRQQELLVDISLKRGDAELIAGAKLPQQPITPHPRRDAALGSFVALLAGVGLSLLREQLNDRIRTAEEAERLINLPLLAELPFDEKADKDRSSARLAVVDRANGPFSESIRALRTSIQYLSVDRPATAVVVTSAAPGEGKSYVAANLAAAFAQADYRTLLVSADLRRSSVDQFFGELSPSPGLTGVIAPFATGAKHFRSNGSSNGSDGSLSTAITDDALVRTPVEGLMILPSGVTPPNPAELLGSVRMDALLSVLSTQFDMIIVDSPPLLPVTDAAVLASKADGVVLVTALSETRRDAATRAAAILEGTGARILGLVVNKAPKSARGGYYSTYYGGMASRPDKSPKQHSDRHARNERPSHRP